MEIKKGILAVIDANVNRSREGLRVTEDISRFIFKDKTLTSMSKKIRHGITFASKKLGHEISDYLESRNSASDKGRHIKQKSEFNRKNLYDIILSNFKRSQESLRVLEEISKLINKKASFLFKELRYETYVLEKKFMLKAGKNI